MADQVAVAEQSLESALLAIAANDNDQARDRNGIGFSGVDTGFGHSLADRVRAGRPLSVKQRHAAWKMLRKYRAQLADAGIDFASIAEPDSPATIAEQVARATDERFMKIAPADPTAVEERSVEVVDGVARIRFAWNDPEFGELKARMRALPGRTWCGRPDERFWAVPVTDAVLEDIAALAGDGFRMDGAEDLLAEFRRHQAAWEASHAMDGEITIPGFGEPARGLKPMPFQRGGIRYVVDHADGRCIIADEMGLGKTIQALGILAHYQCWPALVICPKIAWRNWQREFAKWLPDVRVAALRGRRARMTLEMLDAQVFVINYDILAWWVGRDIVQVDDKGKSHVVGYEPGLLDELGIKAAVVDESHYVKGFKAQRTRAVLRILAGVDGPDGDPITPGCDVRILLTGTPIANRPAELVTQLRALGRLGEFGGFQTFMSRYVYTKDNLKELHQRLRRTCYVRRTKRPTADSPGVLPELPPVRPETVPVQMANVARYQEIEDDLLVWLAEKMEKDAEFAEYLKTLPDDHARGEAKKLRMFGEEGKAYGPAAALLRINALKQVAAEEKLPDVFEYVRNFLDSTTDPDTGYGEKIIVFTWHNHIGDAIAEHFGCDLIHGKVSQSQRDAAEDRFQTDPSARVIVLSIGAASVAITLTAATHCAFVEFPWRPIDIDQAIGRCYGRLNDVHGVNVGYLTAVKDPDAPLHNGLFWQTIDQEVAELIDSKRDVVQQVTDGEDMDAETQSILTDLLKRLALRLKGVAA